MKKIVTITLNPALDMTASLEQINIGKVNLIDNSHLNPGGKGINVAKVLAELGAKVTVTGFLGAENADPFAQLFASRNIIDDFVRVEGASRINVKLVEKNSQVTDLNFPGMKVNEQDIENLEQRIFKLTQEHEIFVLAGSLPQGFSPEILVSWINKLNDLGKKVVFDSSNQALKAGLDAKPWLVKPNDEELSQWAGVPLKTQAALLLTGNALASTGIQNIVISRGAEGVLWHRDGKWLQSQPPKMDVVSTVGAGDTLVAAMCWAQLNQWEMEKSLAFATALSANAVTQVNVGVEDIQQIESLAKTININPVSI